jgi:beta-galactosidase
LATTATILLIMFFGVDYHPEHWVHPYAGSPENPEARWQRDVELMVEAGVNVVRMGEFAWGLYEPEEGQFNFEWMRRAMDLCAKAGIKVVLGTPTAAPPLWLARKHPEILPPRTAWDRRCMKARGARVA